MWKILKAIKQLSITTSTYSLNHYKLSFLIVSITTTTIQGIHLNNNKQSYSQKLNLEFMSTPEYERRSVGGTICPHENTLLSQIKILQRQLDESSWTTCSPLPWNCQEKGVKLISIFVYFNSLQYYQQS